MGLCHPACVFRGDAEFTILHSEFLLLHSLSKLLCKMNVELMCENITSNEGP